MAVIHRRFPLDQIENERVQQALQIMTTEHFTLQGGRAATISESVGRLSTFLATLSGALIALGFVGQVSAFDTTFRAFALILLPAILFVGVVTCARVGQTAAEDGHYLQGINRIHHFYLELVPELSDYLVGSVHDDYEGALRSMGMRPTRWQPLLSIVVMLAVLNSLIAGVLAGLILSWVGPVALAVAVLVGSGVGLVAFGIHVVMVVRAMRRRERAMPPLFPSPRDPEGQQEGL